MKYDKEMYLDSGIYGYGDEDISCHKEKIVKCRKTHECCTCNKEIKIGENALHESGFMDGEVVNAYTCIECIEEWLEESGQVELDEE
ncbi:MAG: hypothetical protein BV457_03435 [Thermoplasmata archaeon M9B1D]|nr:MAG: hypothetical protein BV457_03435 [Thermoplasmata archaeon M9B1D]